MRADAAALSERALGRELVWVDAVVHAAARAARLLPALVSPDAATERARAVAAVRAGERYEPPVRASRRPADRALLEALALAARLAPDVAPRPLAALYRARIEELELELDILGALGDARRVRDLARRRFGAGDRIVGGRRLASVAAEMLDTLSTSDEPRTVPAEGAGSLAEQMRQTALRVGLDLDVRLDARLVAGAATGDRVVFLAPRSFGAIEARRLCAHEVLGHAVASANARAQPLLLLVAGTAGSFGDQEGVAIALEQEAGALDAPRARTLAARVVTSDLVHRGASFTETARHLVHDRGFSVETAVALAERAHRGGGVARDVAYLEGWLRVDGALGRGETTIDELRVGRVGLAALPALRELRALGLVRPPRLVPKTQDALPSSARAPTPDARGCR